MNVHEYQAKRLLKEYGIPIPKGEVVYSPETALNAAVSLGGNRWMVKAQVHAGGRGKSGGIRLVNSKSELISAVKELLGERLVTCQTNQRGQLISKVLIEQPSDVSRELYLGALIDRSLQRIVFIASTEGGIDIEEVSQRTPEKILTITVDPLVGLQPYQCRQLFYKLGLESHHLSVFTTLMLGLYQLFTENDLDLLEVNPLAITDRGEIICLDAKLNIDSNALYRQSKLSSMRDVTQEDEQENSAQQWGLNYIALDGEIGCMVNGAGLAMATMDLIKLHGGRPANFLDVGGGATQERITAAFKIINSDRKVKGILVNIFGGIVHCDTIADGIIDSLKDITLGIPVVVRLEGTHAKLGLEKLSASGLSITPVNGFSEAAKRIVHFVQEGQMVVVS